MAAAGTAVQGRRPLQFADANRFLRRRCAAPAAALTAAPPPASPASSSMVRTKAKEVIMTVISIFQTMSRDAYPALLAGLETQFGHEESVEIAGQFLAAELADFHWESRVAERWLGAYESLDDEESELDRVAILGKLQGTWFVAICLVDGNGAVHELLDLRLMASETDAELAFGRLD
jgi:hypothetical protein